MLYCESCKTLLEGRCDKPGHRLRSPRDNDPVLLLRADRIQSGMMAEIIRQAGIPLLKEGLLGAGMATWTGGMLEEYSLYVPFIAYDKALALIELPPVAEEDGKDEGDE